MDRHPAHGGATAAVVISPLLLVASGGNQGPGGIGSATTIPTAATCAGTAFQDVDTSALLVRWCRALFVATRVTVAP
jgi:hypothetical protein